MRFILKMPVMFMPTTSIPPVVAVQYPLKTNRNGTPSIWRRPCSTLNIFSPPVELLSRIGEHMPIRCSSTTTNLMVEGEQADMGDEALASVVLLRRLLDEVAGKALVITGAGVSTDSGIPDYRGPNGSYSRGHKPMMHDEFISSENSRKRYWARSIFGWPSFSAARPNASHFALANLEAQGRINGIVTQNVDALHQRAGSLNVLDLHGRNDKVKCMSCGLKSSRHRHQEQLARLNATWLATNSLSTAQSHSHGHQPAPVAKPRVEDGQLRADGDAELGEAAMADLSNFEVPVCPRCGGFVKPDVVFFGDSILRAVTERSYSLVDDSELVIVVGSSVQVYSAFRLVHRAAKDGKAIVVINLGRTRAEDSDLDVTKVEAACGTILPHLL